MCFVKTVIFTMWHQNMNKCHELMMDRKGRRQIEWQEWLTDEHWWRREEIRDTRHVPVHQCSEEMKNMTLWIRDYISIYNCFFYTVVV